MSAKVTSTQPIVLLTWADAHSPGSTDVFNASNVHTIHGTLTITTVGWVLRDDHDGVTIAGEHCGDGDYRNVTYIPRSLIVGMTPIRVPRARKTPNASSFTEGVQ